MKVRVTVHLDGGHDIENVQLTFVNTTEDKAKADMIKAMEQLGFKRSDYGHMHITIYV